MATGTIRLHSPALERMTTFSILLPDPKKTGPGPYPVLLQLHGRHDDHTAWLEKSRLWEHVERLPLIVVMPSADNGWWSNLRFGSDDMTGTRFVSFRYEDFLVQELWAHVQASYPARPDARWAIGGLSMGGFGAIRLGLKYPDRFCSIYAHSSVVPTAAELDEWMPELTPATRTDMDCYRLADQHAPETLPRLSFDCGLDDSLLPHNRRFHAHLEARGLPHQYMEFPGAHTWPYWDLHVREALVQHSEVLGIAPLPILPPASAEDDST